MSDEGFHEIQLNGKQLVFLFMATTVVVVVIFLCGVLVGRGVRGERLAAAGDTGVMASADVMPDQRTDKAAAVPEPVTTTPPAPADEGLTYFKRLEGDKAPAEDLKSARAAPSASKPSAASKTSAGRADAEKPAARPAPGKPADGREVVADAKPTSSSPAKVATGEPAGDGFAVQIAALREKAEADSIVKRLADKGYQAYVVAPSGKTAAMYRVRVGKFKTRHDAELMASKLEKEEQFKPWVIR